MHDSIHPSIIDRACPGTVPGSRGRGKTTEAENKRHPDRYHDLKSTVKSVKQGNITNHDQEEKTEKRKSRRNRSNRRWRKTLIS